jgi:nitrogenase molybdenum-iron protein alpha chain
MLNSICSNIQEKDTIFGAADKLKQAFREAERRFHPRLMFITTSCASGIIGEDIEGIANEMEEELGYPIVPVYCEGFKSKVWSTGFDAVHHAVLRKIVKPPKKKQKDLVNVFSFGGIHAYSPLLKRMGLRVKYFISLNTIEEMEEMSEAACSTTICETLSLYVAAALEEQYSVPEIKTAAPYGLDWTDAWLRAIGKATDREEEAERVIAEEKAKYLPEIEELRKNLAGKRLYIMAGDSFASNLANVAISLGLEPVGLTSLHHDPITDNPESVNSLDALVESRGDIANFTVCNIQPYQVIKLVKKHKPDLMLVRHGLISPIGSKLGVPTLFEGDANQSGAYEGVVRLGRRFVEALSTKRFEEMLARYSEQPYTDWWLNEEDPFYFEEK